MHDESRSGQPVSAIENDVVSTVRVIVNSDRRLMPDDIVVFLLKEIKLLVHKF